jgi:predicted ATPase/DNA-binding SARP family transcriptional activator
VGRAAFRILGSLEAERDGVALQLGPPGQRAFLALLLVNLNRVVPRERLIDELWPDDPPATAVKALQVFASRLRREFGDEAGILVTRGQGYLVELEDDLLDARRFERLVENGREALGYERFAEAEARLAEGLSLWRGPALAGLTELPFARDEASRLEELRLLAVEGRLQAQIALGRHADAVPELESLVREYPLRETLHAHWMRALYRAGRQADALAAYRDARRVLQEEVGIEPGAELEALHRAMLNQEPWLDEGHPAEAVRSNLPTQPNPLIGRAAEVADITALLYEQHTRLVSLTGLGGTGKTRLAVQVGADLLEDFPGGVFFVPLAAIREPRLVVPTIAQVLSVRAIPGEELVQTLAAHLDGEQVLLIVDNFEQVIDAATEVARLLELCRHLKVLVTSRERLRLGAERTYPVPPLALVEPDADLDSLLESPAVALFANRAAAATGEFALDAANASTVAEICQRLDGLPLAIELAAARVKLMSERALLERLDQRLKLLTAGARDLDDRQQTLRAAIDWSHSLLSDAEQILFRRLATFAGGRTFDAIETICDPQQELDVFETLASLVEKSLLQKQDDGGDVRFTMLETLHEYAHERLSLDEPDEAAVRLRQAEYFRDLATSAETESRSDWHGFVRRLEPELPNFRLALAEFSGRGDVRSQANLAVALDPLWYRRGLLDEARPFLEHALQDPEALPDLDRAAALGSLAHIAYRRGRFASASALAAEATGVARQAGDPGFLSYTLSLLGLAATGEGDFATARRSYEEALAAGKDASDQVRVSTALGNLADLELATRRYDDAHRWSSEALAIAQELGGEVEYALFNLASAELQLDHLDRATAHALEVLAICRGTNRDGVAACLELVAAIAARRGELERAAQLLGASAALLTEIGNALGPAEENLHAQTLTTSAGDAHRRVAHTCTARRRNLLGKRSGRLRNGLAGVVGAA